MDPLSIGVCSWCLGTSDLSAALETAGTRLGVGVVQVGFFGSAAVRRADVDAIRRATEANGIELSATFVLFDDEDYSSIAAAAHTAGFVPDEHFAARRSLLARVAEITQELGLNRLGVHVGTIPSDPNDPVYAKLVTRIGLAADTAADHDVRILLETGQEPAATLAGMIDDVARANLGVNFDSGNFVMYGRGDAVSAARRLAPRIEHVHLKDALPSDAPGRTWGSEVALGEGQARIKEVVTALGEADYAGPLVVERSRRRTVGEVQHSIDYLRNLLGS